MPECTISLAILTDFRGWHENRLRQAFKRRGIRTLLLSLKDCRIDLRQPHGLALPGFATGSGALPDAAFVRFIPGGSFEQVTRRLDILHALRECGVVVYNDAQVIERTVDKAMTSWLLARAGVPTAPAWSCETLEQARAIVRRATAGGHKLVLKPLFGARGQGLQLLDSAAALPEPEACGGVYYLQGFIPSATQGGRDWRVMVIGGRAVAAMERRSSNWITNRARGGQCLPALLQPPLAELAERAAAAVGAGYAGVDIIRTDPNIDDDDGEGVYRVLEVNGLPAWQGLQAVCATDIAQLLADDLLRRVPACSPLEAVR